MRVINVTPGLMPIPPNGWGAVEKIIWEFHQELSALNIESLISYLDHVDYKPDDIVHIHVSNLALLAHKRKIPYYFTCHDHHAYLYGKDSYAFKENYEAIRHSIKSFVPAKYLVDYFNLPNLEYLSHGVNRNWFKPSDKIFSTHKLLCVANNGFIHDQSEDRKGFLYAIEAAKQLNIPITIAGPINNKKFFDKFNPIYEKLTILYNLSEEELLKVYQSHTLFIHPSSLEAGHPNLTLLEAMSCGLPVVGTFEENNSLPGLYRIERTVESVTNGIKHVIQNYDKFRTDCLNTTYEKSWRNITSQLINFYNKKESYMKTQLEEIYNTTKIVHRPRLLPRNTIKCEFTDGCKLEVVGSNQREYNVKFFDKRTNRLIYESNIKNNMWCMPSMKYFVDWQVKILDLTTKEESTIDLDLYGKDIKIVNDSPSLGDFISWIPYVDKFQKTYNCNLDVYTPNTDLFKETYPNINFLTYNSTPLKEYYASYKLGCFMSDSSHQYSPKDYRTQNLQQIAAEVLGFEYIETLPVKLKSTRGSNFSKKYVCIATQSTSQCKYWTSEGWQQTVDYLKSLDYEVVCIDRHSQYGNGNDINFIPKNCIDKTGDIPLQDRIDDISNCEFFIGLSSGLSWLAWACHKPVVMISGFTKAFNEFNTPYRVINESVCNGCWNNTQFKFDHGDWNWCPVNKNTSKQFECYKKIDFSMVKEKIDLLINPNEKIKTTNKFDPFTYKEIFEYNQYEKFVQVNNNDLVVDLGCSMGYFYIKHKNKNINYIGVDGSTDCLSDFIENLKGDETPMLIHSLIDSKKSIQTFASMFHNNKEQKSMSMTFPDLIKLIGRHIDFLKFDIEGYEKTFLDENYDLFKSCVERFSGEFHFSKDPFPRNRGYEVIRKILNDKDLVVKLFSADGWDITDNYKNNPDYYTEIIISGFVKKS